MPGIESKTQFGFPSEENGIDNARTNAKNTVKTVKAASFDGGPLQTPITDGKFSKEPSAPNPLQASKFKQRTPEGI